MTVIPDPRSVSHSVGIVGIVYKFKESGGAQVATVPGLLVQAGKKDWWIPDDQYILQYPQHEEASISLGLQEIRDSIRAGTYNINAGISLNTKGDLYFEPETTVTITSGTAFSAFSCSVNEDKKIYGYADFIVNNSTSLISLTASSPTIYFECNSITGATNSTLFTTAVSSTLNISIRGGGINTGSAKIFSLGGNSKISIDAGTIICNKYLSSDSGATSLINSTIQNLTTNNVISGIDITATGTANFYIDHYTHSGVGLSCAWQENATVEKIAFINTIWYTSDTSKNHISLDSTQASVSNKKIKLVGTNTFCGITNTTNCITSTKAVNIYVQNSYAATGAHANVSFKIGMFTVDTDVNNFN